jgi:hypothetical protein
VPQPFASRLALIVSSLCGSALAVATMLYAEGELARAELALTPEVAQESPRFVAAATVGSTLPRDVPARSATTSRAEPAPLVVPDFTGKRLSVARREARALGLKLVARDAYGDRILPEFAGYYRVKKQLTQVGTRLAPGDTVQVRVRELPGAALGY